MKPIPIIMLSIISMEYSCLPAMEELVVKINELNARIKRNEYIIQTTHHLEELSDHVHIALDRAGTIQALLEALQDSPTATKIQKKYYRLYSQELFLNQFSTISFFYDCAISLHNLLLFPSENSPIKNPTAELDRLKQQNSEAKAIINSLKIIVNQQQIPYSRFNNGTYKKISELTVAQTIIARQLHLLLQQPHISTQFPLIEDWYTILCNFNYQHEKLHELHKALAQIRLFQPDMYAEKEKPICNAILNAIERWFTKSRPNIENKLHTLANQKI